MSKNEMSPFGKAVFDLFSEITKAQAEMVRVTKELSKPIIHNEGHGVKGGLDDFLEHNPNLSENWKVNEPAKKQN